MNDKIYMGPLRGFTERPFRDAFAEHFSGVDAVMAPFIPLVEADYVNPSRLKDILPANEKIHLIPQVIGNKASQIVQMAHLLESYGFDEINLNLGCPMPKITRKQRGSGLLKDPEKVLSLLQNVIDDINIRFSVKTRIGFRDNTLFDELADVFNSVSLASLTVHSRTGVQMYSGKADPEFFAPFVEKLSSPELIYNGDIFSVEDLKKLKTMMPRISSWMIGRGLVRNPFLGEWIKTGCQLRDRKRFGSFHTILNANIEGTSDTEKGHLNRMKGYWTQFRYLYEDQQQIQDSLLRAQSIGIFLKNADQIIASSAMK